MQTLWRPMFPAVNPASLNLQGMTGTIPRLFCCVKRFFDCYEYPLPGKPQAKP